MANLIETNPLYINKSHVI